MNLKKIIQSYHSQQKEHFNRAFFRYLSIKKDNSEVLNYSINTVCLGSGHRIPFYQCIKVVFETLSNYIFSSDQTLFKVNP